MARLFEVKANTTYASYEGAVKAVNKRLGDTTAPDGRELRYFVACTPEGRYFPVFVGETALQAGVHYNYNVIM